MDNGHSFIGTIINWWGICERRLKESGLLIDNRLKVLKTDADEQTTFFHGDGDDVHCAGDVLNKDITCTIHIITITIIITRSRPAIGQLFEGGYMESVSKQEKQQNPDCRKCLETGLVAISF